MYIFNYIYKYIYIYKYKYLYTYIYTYIFIYMYVYVCIYICTYVNAYVYMYTYICVCVYVYTCTYMHVYIHARIYTYTYTHMYLCSCAQVRHTGHTGWQRPIECLQLQVIIRKRATNCRALLWKMTYKDKASYDFTPPFIKFLGFRNQFCAKLIMGLFCKIAPLS